jgi:ATP-dependent exoDNAse (exonuclease V) beta subunit
MEAGAVIVTDIDRIMDADAMALFYVAITRALHRLIVLVGEPVKGTSSRF